MNEPIPSAVALTQVAPTQWKPETGFHCTLLLLCGGVLLASSLLSVRGAATIVLPSVEIPLPALCMSRRVFGFDCPGCGMTRSFVSLAHGDLAAAWSFNPAGIWLFAMMAFQVPYRAVQLWRIRHGMRELSLPRTAHFALVVFAVALVGQWLVRITAAWL